MDERPDWDSYFLSICDVVSTRSTCARRSVGVVITRDRRILTTGYNGSPAGYPHCQDVGCDIREGHCVATIHAEANALAQAALHGVSTNGATLYTTCSVCLACAKLVLAAGIVRVVYKERYEDSEPLEYLAWGGVDMQPLK